MRRKLGYLLVIALVMSCISYGIVRITNRYENKEGKTEDELVIVTSFYPMYIAALNITDQVEGVAVKNLTENQTGCVHDYQLTTKDMRTLSGADIAILNGGELEQFMEDVIGNYPDLKVITASEGMEYLQGIAHDHNHEEDVQADDHVHEDETAVTDEHAGHNHGDINGHVWMNMDLYMKEIQNITDALCKYDEEHEGSYRKNAEQYIAKIEGLKEEYKDLYSLANGQEIIIFHDAFAYLADELGMEVVHTVDTDSESALSAGEIGEVIEEINLHDIKLLFTEVQYSAAIAERIASETDAKVYVMDSLVTGDANKDAYLTGMRNNLNALRDALNR